MSHNNFKKAQVTIALSAYNAEDTIVDAIRSIQNQTYTNFHLYIIDDACTDKTKNIILNTIQDDRITLISMKQNIGTYAAKNLVLKHFAEGEFYAHQDADDFSLEDRFSTQIAFLNENNFVACGTGIDEFFKDPSVIPRFSQNIEAFFNSDDGFYHKYNKYPETISLNYAYEQSIPIEDLKLAMNGSLMFRTEIVKKMGGFDGKMFVAGDSDLILRLLPFYQFGNVQKILYARRFHKKSLTGSQKTGFESPLRRNILDTIEEKRLSILNCIKNNDLESAFVLAKTNLFYPTAAFEVWPLG